MADTYMQVKCEWKIERELYENIGFSYSQLSCIHDLAQKLCK